eukprot:2236145-Prorocentrum_lima.AAC.1
MVVVGGPLRHARAHCGAVCKKHDNKRKSMPADREARIAGQTSTITLYARAANAPALSLHLELRKHCAKL